jgi:hypothetical protein
LEKENEGCVWRYSFTWLRVWGAPQLDACLDDHWNFSWLLEF